jgi:hypothetical protein
MKKLSPIGLLFVDLMASTFAIIFLVLFITLLKTSQEVDVPTPNNPTKKKSSYYRIVSVQSAWSDGDGTSHPYIEQTDYKTSYSGYIEAHEEYVSFYKKYNDIPQKIEEKELQKKDNKLIEFLKSLDNSKLVHIELYSPKYIYRIDKLTDSNKLFWVIDYAYKDDDKKKNKKKNKKIDKENNVNANIQQPSQKIIQETFEKLERNAQKAIKKNKYSIDNDVFWEWLTQKVYRDKGYDLYYYKDKDKIFFTHADVIKYLYPLLDPPTKKEPYNWWLLLILLGMSYYLYKEFTLSAKENYL